MAKRTFGIYANEEQYRLSMVCKLRRIGCQFDNSETTAELEEMMRINNLEVQDDG